MTFNESIMTSNRKHNSVLLRAQEHSIIAQFLSIMCQGLMGGGGGGGGGAKESVKDVCESLLRNCSMYVCM